MSLSEDEVERLERLIENADAHQDRLSEWERNFMADQVKRYEEHGAGMYLSSPQWKVLTRIEEKVNQ